VVSLIPATENQRKVYMRKQLFLTAFCAGCFAFVAQAQTHSGGTSTERTAPDTGLNQSQTSQDSSQQPSTWDRVKGLAATGGTQHEVRASQITSAQVKSSSGESIGTINELIINPNSGKVDFAVISLSGSTGSASSSTPSSGTLGTSSTTSGTAGSTAGGTKQVAVPWSLLHAGLLGSTTTSSSMAQMSFTFSGDVNKLQTAPVFDPNPDLSKPGWFQNAISYFSKSGSATGGATSPGGTSSGSQSYPQGQPK
jgi:sporulation protein YlmC with PRC-barrel domain